MKLKPAHKGAIAGSASLLALATGLVGAEEGLRLKAYQDIVGVWTICYGETSGVRPGQVATAAECRSQLARQLPAYEAGMDRCLVVEVPGVAKVQMLSLTYNIGVGAFCGSSVVRRANAGDLRGACEAMLGWNKVRIAGVLVPSPGLDARRHRERDACVAAVEAA